MFRFHFFCHVWDQNQGLIHIKVVILNISIEDIYTNLTSRVLTIICTKM
jgi:hypothetical protein